MHRYRHHLTALLGYLALTLLMTYPLVRQLSRGIPGDGFDGWQNVWNLWWVKRALLVEGTNPYFTRFVDYPDGVYLYFHTLNIFNGLTFLPFTLNAGLLVAYNVAVVFSFVMGGYGAYLLALYVLRQGSDNHSVSEVASRYKGSRSRLPVLAPWPGGQDGPPCGPGQRDNHSVSEVASRYKRDLQVALPFISWHAHLAAFLGGAIFTFSPYHMAHLLGHMQLISLEWIPFFALFQISNIKCPFANRHSPIANRHSPFAIRYSLFAIRRALLAAIFLILIAACDWYYAFYMVLFTGLVLLWTGWRRRVWLAPSLAVAATGLIFVLVTSPVLAPIVRESLTSDYMVPPPDSVERLSADLTAFFTPSELHPLWGKLAAGWAGRFTATTSERTVFAGYSVLALGLLALLARRRAAGFWGLSALTFALLALGPVLHVGGQTRLAGVGPIPLPYALLRQALPLLKISRSVSRFDVVVTLSLGVLAAVGLNWLLSRTRQVGYNEGARWLVAVGALLAVGVEFWVAPYPMSYPETRPFHYQLAQEPGQFAVMDVPMDYWDRPANLLYQTVHQRPTISGYTSRTNPLSPAGRTPVLQTFRYLGPDINTADPRALAPTVLTDLNVRYVIVHKTDLPPGNYRETTLALADDIFKDWPVVVDDDWLKVFRVPPPAARLPYLVLGEGWTAREWRDGGPARALAGPSATLLVQLPAAQTVRLELNVHCLDEAGSLGVRSGERVIGVYPVSRQPTAITTPDLPLPAGESVVEIRADSAPANLIVTRVNLVSN